MAAFPGYIPGRFVSNTSHRITLLCCRALPASKVRLLLPFPGFTIRFRRILSDVYSATALLSHSLIRDYLPTIRRHKRQRIKWFRVFFAECIEVFIVCTMNPESSVCYIPISSPPRQTNFLALFHCKNGITKCHFYLLSKIVTALNHQSFLIFFCIFKRMFQCNFS